MTNQFDEKTMKKRFKKQKFVAKIGSDSWSDSCKFRKMAYYVFAQMEAKPALQCVSSEWKISTKKHNSRFDLNYIIKVTKRQKNEKFEFFFRI